MFAILAIFSFIIVLFLTSIKIIELVFVAKRKFKPDYMKSIFTAFTLFIWFIASTISTIFISIIFFKLPYFFSENSQLANADVVREKKDCQILIDTIYSLENKIYKSDNHRYIEEVSPIFTVKLEYQRGAKKLNSVAKEYLALNVTKNSQNYTQQLAEKLEEKAQLFEKRTEIVEQDKGIKKIINLLDKMDRVTEERQNIIEDLKKQCQ